jgi:hypothetical protein
MGESLTKVGFVVLEAVVLVVDGEGRDDIEYSSGNRCDITWEGDAAHGIGTRTEEPHHNPSESAGSIPNPKVARPVPTRAPMTGAEMPEIVVALAFGLLCEGRAH